MQTRFVVAPLAVAALIAVVPNTSAAQEALRSAPVATALPDPVPAARDVPFPGTVKLDIDATDLTRGIFRVNQVFPVPPGTSDMILLLPEWIPGKHASRGMTNLLADVRFEVDGKPVAWTRDPVTVAAFHVPVPAGAKQVSAYFVHTSPLQKSEGRIVMTQEMLNLQWDSMSLYPAGYYVRQIKVNPTVTFPAGWTVFTALDGQKDLGKATTWDTVAYDTLVDSPVFAGKHAEQFDLGHAIRLDVVADEPDLLEIEPAHLATFRKLADEALALFGARHFDHYDSLLALTDRMGGIGLEHHRSSENQYYPKTLVDWDAMGWDRNVIAHELVHSWNGKYRRPAGLWTPDYHQPKQGELLWVYEGQTQFWGNVLAARSGLQAKDVVLGALANQAGYYATQPGREWRPVVDTTRDPIINARRPLPYSSLSRSEDYYNEGMLVWLEADQIIRKGTGGAKGMDDFARGFFGVNDGDWGELTYTFDDVVAALNAVYPHDWAGFLTKRFYAANQPAPLAGLESAGYRLVWKDEPNPYEKGRLEHSKDINLTYSLGFTLDKDGKVKSPIWDSPAFDAGIVTGAEIVAVDGEAFSKDVILDAVKAAKDGKKPIELLIKRGTRYLTVPVDYHGGLRYPWIEPVGAGEQPLDRLLAPRTGEPAQG
ncbi:M61 family metallopeptidase [Croceibacterium aestuarii]|uniref:M61 family metallopeptidase n=1 Tax=Croceibacterium aestuarii TaxID=3064139 RepID=UPI00272E64F4|nr:peptidase M61 [Croceibacterium sp. D39]